MSSEDEEDFFDDGLEVDDDSSAERGCYWFVISLVYLNMVNFVHLNSKVLSFWRDCLPLGKYHNSCVYIYCWSFESFNTVICFLLPHTQHEQGKVIVRVYRYMCVCVVKRLNHTLVVTHLFNTHDRSSNL